jgi:hypothetical protein
MGFITKIEKFAAGGKWQESNSSDIQLKWTGTDNPVTEIRGGTTAYVNVVHINQTDNKIGVWQTRMPIAAEEFVKNVGTYRFTVSVMSQGVTRRIGIEIDWRGQWDTIQARPAQLHVRREAR